MHSNVVEALKKAKVVVFDLDGVIIKKNLLQRAMIKRAIKKNPLKFALKLNKVREVKKNVRRKMKEGNTGEAVVLAFEELMRHFNVCPDEILKEFRRLVSKEAKDAIAFMQTLRSEGKKIVISTQNVDPGLPADYVLSNEPLSVKHRNFDEKWKRTRELLKKLGAKPEEVVIFEDTVNEDILKFGAHLVTNVDLKKLKEAYKCARRPP